MAIRVAELACSIAVMTSIPTIDGARSLAGRYPVWLCDIWGVLHNGVAAYPAASAALVAFRGAGGTAILITNAPRPCDDVKRQIANLGVSAEAHDAIVTSGDVTRALIVDYGKRPLFHLGPERDSSLFAGTGARLTGIDGAEAVVCTGLIDDVTETPDSYKDQLAAMRERNLPMICANPDIVVERGAAICYCAGAIGQAYEAMGGHVAYAGKPHAPIYEAAMARAAQVRGAAISKRDVLAIGDGLHTDILGARRFGIDALFVASGIHLSPSEGLNERTLAKLFSGQGPHPIAATAHLAW